jgi:hypothetical protein
MQLRLPLLQFLQLLLPAFVLLTPVGSAAGTAGGSFNSAFVGNHHAATFHSYSRCGACRWRGIGIDRSGRQHSEHEKSYTRAPMRARSMAPHIEYGGAATTQNVKPFTIEEQRWFNQANGSRW